MSHLYCFLLDDVKSNDTTPTLKWRLNFVCIASFTVSHLICSTSVLVGEYSNILPHGHSWFLEDEEDESCVWPCWQPPPSGGHIDGSVYHFGPDWKISTTSELIAMKYGTDSHSPQRVKHGDDHKVNNRGCGWNVWTIGWTTIRWVFLCCEFELT